MQGSRNSIILSVLGVALIITYFVFMQLRSHSGKPAVKVAKAEKIKEVGNSITGEGTKILEAGLFEIQIPEKLTYPPDKYLQEVTDPNSMQSITAPYYRYRSNDGVSWYEVGYMRLPESRFQEKNVDEIMDDLTKGELERFQGLLIKETTVNKNLYSSSREIEIQSNSTGIFARELLVINRPYVFIVSYTSKTQNNLQTQNVNKYFSSFNLFTTDQPNTIVYSGAGQ